MTQPTETLVSLIKQHQPDISGRIFVRYRSQLASVGVYPDAAQVAVLRQTIESGLEQLADWMRYPRADDHIGLFRKLVDHVVALGLPPEFAASDMDLVDEVLTAFIHQEVESERVVAEIEQRLRGALDVGRVLIQEHIALYNRERQR